MGILVKLVGSGIGMASEAIHDYRSRSKSQSQSQTQSQTHSQSRSGLRSPSPDPAAAPVSPSSSSQSRQLSVPASDQPPAYVEVADEATADNLIRSGRAERVVDYADEKRGKSKAAEAGYDDDDSSSSSSSSGDELDGDEAAWELDDMASRVAPPAYANSEAEAAMPAEADTQENKDKKAELMIRELVKLAGPPPTPARRIPCPVIIPQRRPRNKDRGFVRAYAPVLQECGVGQDLFLKFLKDWHLASKSDPWIDVIFVAAAVVGFVPEAAAQIVSTVVQVAAGTARELQSRSRRNTFLDLFNEQVLMPRGLYAMVMAFKDEIPGQQALGPLSNLAGTLGQTMFKSERLDINQTAAKYSNPDPELSKLKRGLKNIRLVNGKTHSEIELPEAAALVYPDLDRVAERDLEQEEKGKGPGVKDKWKGAGKWVQGYLDRKAQAAYARDHEGSSLAVPAAARSGFSSRFSDPSHPANSGSLVSLVTGGVVNPDALRQELRARKGERRGYKREYKDMRRMARGRSPRGPRRGRGPRGQRKPGIIKKLLQKDVMYLIIVNLPTKDEVEQSVADLERVVSTRENRA